VSGVQTLSRQSCWPPLPEKTCPLLSSEVRGYPQEVVWNLRYFRAIKFPLRHIIGSRVTELFVVDKCALIA